jgi:hypothetical protein
VLQGFFMTGLLFMSGTGGADGIGRAERMTGKGEVTEAARPAPHRGPPGIPCARCDSAHSPRAGEP